MPRGKEFTKEQPIGKLPEAEVRLARWARRGIRTVRPHNSLWLPALDPGVAP